MWSVMKISADLRGHLRIFAYCLVNRTLDLEILPQSIDYSAIFEEPSAMEQAIAIWTNVISLDESGRVVNCEAANQRVAQYIRSYIDPGYEVLPPFADWELELAL
jgi:hypothetical protein